MGFSASDDSARTHPLLRGFALRAALLKMAPWRSFRRGGAVRLVIRTDSRDQQPALAELASRALVEARGEWVGLELHLVEGELALVLRDRAAGGVTSRVLALARLLSVAGQEAGLPSAAAKSEKDAATSERRGHFLGPAEPRPLGQAFGGSYS